MRNGENKMRFTFNENKLNKIENTPIKETTLKYVVDTKNGINSLLCIAGLIVFMFVIYIIGSIILPSGRVGAMPAIICIGGIIGMIKYAIYHFGGGNYKKLKSYCQSNGIDISDVENDFKNRRIYGNALCAVGDRYFICIDRVIPVDDIYWVFYSDYKTHTEGKDSKKFFLEICYNDGTITEYYAAPEYAAAILNELNRKHPNIVMGYSFALEKLYANERDEFIAKADAMRPESIYEMKSLNL